MYFYFIFDLDIVQFQADAENLFEWSKTWLLNINNSKCKSMRIGHGISSVTPHSYFIDGATPL